MNPKYAHFDKSGNGTICCTRWGKVIGYSRGDSVTLSYITYNSVADAKRAMETARIGGNLPAA